MICNKQSQTYRKQQDQRRFGHQLQTHAFSKDQIPVNELAGTEKPSAQVVRWSSPERRREWYPFHIGVVYTSPVQWGPANPPYRSKTGYHATMWGIPYDDLEGWRGPYPPEVFAGQFEKMTAGFRAAATELQLARSQGEDDLRFTSAGCQGRLGAAVGSRAFVERVAKTITHLQRLHYMPIGESAWKLKGAGSVRKKNDGLNRP